MLIVWVNYLQEFLSLDEINTAKEKETAKIYLDKLNGFDNKLDKANQKERTKPTALVLSGVSASWLPDTSLCTLKNLTLTIPPGEFIGVAGLVGSGKVLTLIPSLLTQNVFFQLINCEFMYHLAL